MNIASDLQLRAFGYVDPQPPIPGSWKEKVYELLASGRLTNEQIEQLAQTSKRMHEQIEQRVINPIVERLSNE